MPSAQWSKDVTSTLYFIVDSFSLFRTVSVRGYSIQYTECLHLSMTIWRIMSSCSDPIFFHKSSHSSCRRKDEVGQPPSRAPHPWPLRRTHFLDGARRYQSSAGSAKENLLFDGPSSPLRDSGSLHILYWRQQPARKETKRFSLGLKTSMADLSRLSFRTLFNLSG